MATNPSLLIVPLAENGNKNTLPENQGSSGQMSQSTGFPPETSLPLGAGGVAPSREDFNGAFNLLGGVAFYAQKGWQFLYDNDQDYYAGCIVRDADDGKLYECVADMTAGTVAPHSDTENTYWKEFSLGGGVPVGFIMPYAGTGLAEGFLDCDGSAVSRTMYPDLFAAIGITWGAGDGSTTFNLPRSEDLVLQGASTTNPVGTYLQAGLPNIEGTAKNYYAAAAMPVAEGCFYRDSNNVGNSISSQSAGYGLGFDASQSNSIYGASDTVQAPAACVRFMIKAFDGQTPDSALIDVTQYAADLATRLQRQQVPAFNHRDVITTSGTYTAPVTGWYRITVKGGGGGGSGSTYYTSTYGCRPGAGGEGGTTIAYQYMTAGDTATVTIGAGGAGGAAGPSSSMNITRGADGGNSSVVVNGNTYTGGGGTGGYNTVASGGTGTIVGASGEGMELAVWISSGFAGAYGSRTGSGAGTGGEGGTVFLGSPPSTSAGGDGGDGVAWFEYFDGSLNP